MGKNQVIDFILACLKPFKWQVICLIVVSITWAIDITLRPYLVKLIIDKITHLNHIQEIDQLSGLFVLFICMSLFINIMFRLQDYIWLNFNPPLKRHIGDVLMKKTMDHSLGMLQNHFAGNLANKVKDAMSGIPDLVRLINNQFFSHFLAFIIAIFTFCTVSYKFSALLSLWIVIFVLGSLFFSKRIKRLSEHSAEVRSSVIGRIVDIISNISSVHLFATKKAESKKFQSYLDKYVKADQDRDWWFLYMFSFQGLSFVIYQAICFKLLLSGFKLGNITVGDFALLIIINATIIDCLWSLSKDIMSFAEMTGNINQGLRIALSEIEIKDQNHAKTLTISKGDISFVDVRFNYKDSESLFQNKSVTILAGEKVGLVGYSGGGKTSFVNLILRLYDVTEGKILIDNQDIREVTQDSLHANIGMIPQDPSLFHRSLMENIRYGKIDASDEEVIEAAKKAHAHEFIIKLPLGYDSLVGERGVKLSGGQRQRIAIARAILKNSPILMLDEATSQLDSVTEKLIQDSLWGLMQGKTTIVIAHRLSTLLHMDRILVFDQGKIVGDGSHAELLSKTGLYKTLWEAQIEGFLPDQKEDL